MHLPRGSIRTIVSGQLKAQIVFFSLQMLVETYCMSLADRDLHITVHPRWDLFVAHSSYQIPRMYFFRLIQVRGSVQAGEGAAGRHRSGRTRKQGH